MKRIQKNMIVLSIGFCLFGLMGCQSEKESVKEKQVVPTGSTSHTSKEIESLKETKKVNLPSDKTEVTITYLSKEPRSFSKQIKMRADSANQFLYSFLTGQRAKQNELSEPFAKLQIKGENTTSDLSSGTYFITKRKGDYYISEENKLEAIKLLSKRELQKLQKFVGAKDEKNLK